MGLNEMRACACDLSEYILTGVCVVQVYCSLFGRSWLVVIRSEVRVSSRVER